MNGSRILGIDPGLNITGYGILDKTDRQPRLVEAGVIRGKSRGTLAERVRDIHNGLTDIIESYSPSALALEELFSHYKRPKTAILMGHAGGVICLAAANANIAVNGYSATQVKKILTGSGRAPKSQVQFAVKRELGLSEMPEPADVAGALAIAMCHYYLAKPELIA